MPGRLDGVENPGMPTYDHRREWTDEETAWLIAHPELTAREAAHHLDRPVQSVEGKRERLQRAGMIPAHRSRYSDPGTGRRTPYSDAELALIRDRTLTTVEVAQRTGRNETAIAGYRRRHGIRPDRPAEPRHSRTGPMRRSRRSSATTIAPATNSQRCWTCRRAPSGACGPG